MLTLSSAKRIVKSFSGISFVAIFLCFFIGSFSSVASPRSHSNNLMIRTLPNGVENNSKLQVTVNSDERYVRISLSNSNKGTGHYAILHKDGTVFISEEIPFWDGSTVIDLSLDDFETGNYTVTMSFEGETYSHDFTI